MSAATSQELKGYQSQLSRAKANHQVLQTASVAAQRQAQAAANEVAALEKKIRELQETTPEPIVSEHALLRWLERVDGVDFTAVRNRILDGGTEASIKFAKNGKLTKNGHTIIFKNNTVVTVE